MAKNRVISGNARSKNPVFSAFAPPMDGLDPFSVESQFRLARLPNSFENLAGHYLAGLDKMLQTHKVSFDNLANQPFH